MAKIVEMELCMRYDDVIQILRSIAPTASIYLVGSHSLPYIQHPHDTDYLVWCRTKEEIKAICSWKMQHKNELPSDVHFIPRYKIEYNCFLYEWHFMKNGDQFDADLYDTAHLQKVLDNCYRILRPCGELAQAKSYYHVYTTCCMLINGNYQLSEVEIEQINRFHDGLWNEQDYKDLQTKWEIVAQQFNFSPIKHQFD